MNVADKQCAVPCGSRALPPPRRCAGRSRCLMADGPSAASTGGSRAPSPCPTTAPPTSARRSSSSASWCEQALACPRVPRKIPSLSERPSNFSRRFPCLLIRPPFWRRADTAGGRARRRLLSAWSPPRLSRRRALREYRGPAVSVSPETTENGNPKSKQPPTLAGEN